MRCIQKPIVREYMKFEFNNESLKELEAFTQMRAIRPMAIEYDLFMDNPNKIVFLTDRPSRRTLNVRGGEYVIKLDELYRPFIALTEYDFNRDYIEVKSGQTYIKE